MSVAHVLVDELLPMLVDMGADHQDSRSSNNRAEPMQPLQHPCHSSTALQHIPDQHIPGKKRWVNILSLH
jgi:hypothetical protein